MGEAHLPLKDGIGLLLDELYRRRLGYSHEVGRTEVRRSLPLPLSKRDVGRMAVSIMRAYT